MILSDDEKLYSTGDVAKKCGVAKATIYTWINRGEIGDVRNRTEGGTRIFTEEDLQRFLKYAESKKGRKKRKGKNE